MKAVAFLHSSKESMYDLGQKIGLVGEPLDKFMYALYEVKFEIEVDPKTGNAKIVSVDDRNLK